MNYYNNQNLLIRISKEKQSKLRKWTVEKVNKQKVKILTLPWTHFKEITQIQVIIPDKTTLNKININGKIRMDKDNKKNNNQDEHHWIQVNLIKILDVCMKICSPNNLNRILINKIAIAKDNDVSNLSLG